MTPDIILRERSLSQKVTYCMSPFIKMYRMSKSTKTKVRGCQELGERRTGVKTNGCGVSFGSDIDI
jgi:hypothetical protein